MSTHQVDNITDAAGSGAPAFPNGATSATGFYGASTSAPAKFPAGLIINKTPTITAGDLTIATNDGVEYVICTATSGAKTMTLPAAAANAGRRITFKKTGGVASSVILDPAGSETVDDQSTYTMVCQYDCVTVISDGSNWHAVYKQLLGIPAFAAKSSVTQSVTNGTPTKLNFANEIYDTMGCFASSEFTVPVAGIYTFSFNFTVDATTAYIYAILRKNGSTAVAMNGQEISGTPGVKSPNASGSLSGSFVAGDVVSLWCEHGGAGARNVVFASGSAEPNFSGHLIART